MSDRTTCAGASLAAGEPLAATATEGSEWLLVEVRGAWGRDALADTELPEGVRSTLEGFPGKVVFIRRPHRRSGVVVLQATSREQDGIVTRRELSALDQITGLDLEGGDPVAGPVVLVCGHGRRDACCARLGVPLFDGLQRQSPGDGVWLSSHQGGHRFAPNLLVLPLGIQLGRVPLERAGEVLELLGTERIPLDLYRGRTIYPPPVQAAEILARTVTGCDGVFDLQLVSTEDDLVTFATAAGELTARVERQSGPPVPASCGVGPESAPLWVARLESAA